MRAVLRLQIHHGVPVAVEEDDGVRRGEINTLPARTSREEEDLPVRVGVELGDLLFSLLEFDGAVDARAVPPAEGVGVVVEDVEGGGELAEYKNFVVPGEKRGEELVE